MWNWNYYLHHQQQQQQKHYVLKYKIIGKPDDFIIGKPNDYDIGTNNANLLYNAKHTLRELSARISFIVIILRKYKKYF